MTPWHRTFVALALAGAAWIPNVHRFYEVDSNAQNRIAASLAKRAIAGDDGVTEMRATNPEWDYMTRTFTVLGLASRAIANDGAREASLAAIDRIVDDTREEAREPYRFLLPYAHASSFVDDSARSVFVDGELLMMIAARDLVSPRPDLDDEADALAETITASMKRSPTLSAESYPNECWTFCNTTALAALAMLDRIHPRAPNHRELADAWVLQAKSHLVDARTGILVSSYTREGRVLDGVEGSSIWMSATNLLLVDAAFARDQYARARRELGVVMFGFGFAREWPRGAPLRPDVDSGPVIPLLDASAGSSGFAVLGASAFGDDEFRNALFASLELAAMPRDVDDERRYLASNRVGDAVLLDALTFGPLWSRVR